MILVVGLVLAVVGAWLSRHELTPMWGAAGRPADITTASAMGVRVGQPLYLGSVREPMIVVQVQSPTSFTVARSKRIGWQVHRRYAWRRP